MGKITFKGPVPPDHPMFIGGVELFRKTDTTPVESDTNLCDPTQKPFKVFREFTVNWGGDLFSLEIDKAVWKRISTGKTITCEVFEERFDIYIHWHFNSDPEHNLILDYGDPKGGQWIGNIDLS